MDKDDRKLSQIRHLLDEVDEKLHAVRRVLFEQIYKEQAENLEIGKSGPSTIIEGVFDGENMINKQGQKYQVPANYCSKSKLVPGDNLKLTIQPDGSFIFKQIGPVERKRLMGKLVKDGEHWQVLCEGKKFNVLAPRFLILKPRPMINWRWLCLKLVRPVGLQLKTLLKMMTRWKYANIHFVVN